MGKEQPKDSVVAEDKEVKETPEVEETDGVTEDDFVPKTDEDGEEGETSSDLEKDADSEQDDESKEEKDESESKEEDLGLEDELSLDDFEEVSEKKSGVQKRIDKLVAEKKALEERLIRLEEKPKDKDSPEYSESQLRHAMAKAIEENDANLMYEIMDYRIKKAQKEAIEGERKRQVEAQEMQRRHQQEWISVIEENEYLADSEEPELYKGSHKDLNIKNPDSTLYKLATKLYADPERAERYRKDGGQRLAVSDAIRMILRKKNSKSQSKETTILKRQLAKEKKKSSVSSGKAVKTESTKPISSRTSLEEYMAERKKAKAAISGEL
jgi:hypothetical protein